MANYDMLNAHNQALQFTFLNYIRHARSKTNYISFYERNSAHPDPHCLRC